MCGAVVTNEQHTWIQVQLQICNTWKVTNSQSKRRIEFELFFRKSFYVSISQPRRWGSDWSRSRQDKESSSVSIQTLYTQMKKKSLFLLFFVFVLKCAHIYTHFFLYMRFSLSSYTQIGDFVTSGHYIYKN